MKRALFVLLVLLYTPLTVFAQNARFPKVENLNVSYLSSKSKVKVTWDAVEGAEKYRVVVKDENGNKVTSLKAKSNKKKFKGSLLEDGEQYKIKVKALKTADMRTSKARKTTYTHSASGGDSQTGTVSAENSSGRNGSYYLPTGYINNPLPVMLAFHGTGGSGSSMVDAFAGLAEEYGFIIIAPDSRKSPGGLFTWEVGTAEGEITDDVTHAMNCLNEVLAYSGVDRDSEKMLVVGYSGGGSFGPYLSTNKSRFTHFGSLHGGLFTGGLGDNSVTGWFSTGTDDTARAPTEVENYKNSMEGLGYDVEYHEYAGGHSLGSTEKKEFVQWWLD